MILLPSEHPTEILQNPSGEVYLPDFHEHVEQSAIYEKIRFTAVGEEDAGIVLTSQCDIQDSDESSYVLVARITSVGELLLYWLVEKNKYTEAQALGKEAIPKDRKQRNSLVKDFTEAYLKNKTFQYHFLPEIPEKMKASLICFDITQCMTVKELTALNKVAVLKSPFRESVPAHFSAFIGRIGTPAIDHDYLIEVVSKQCSIKWARSTP